MKINEKKDLKVIIFDLDRTIFDWDKVQLLARSKVNQILKYYDIHPHDFWISYDKYHDQLFNWFLEQKMSLKEYRIARYSKPLEKFGIESEELASQLNQTFVSYALNEAIFCKGVEQVLGHCKQYHVKKVILTNGPAYGQRTKIKNLGLLDYIDEIYVSEERGVAKPSEQAFLQICEDYSVEPQECLMVGDDIDVDILPAKKLGMHVFWVENKSIPQKKDQFISQPITDLIDYLEQFNIKSPSET
jgi:putative hydrolase of the HAD superfamily